MKKTLSFFILFIPWLFSLIFIFFNQFNIFNFYYFFLSFIFYIFISLYFYDYLKHVEYDNNFLLNVILLYLINQSFNIFIFYYHSIFSSSIFGIAQVLIIIKIFINSKKAVWLLLQLFIVQCKSLKLFHFRR